MFKKLVAAAAVAGALYSSQASAVFMTDGTGECDGSTCYILSAHPAWEKDVVWVASQPNGVFIEDYFTYRKAVEVTNPGTYTIEVFTDDAPQNGTVWINGTFVGDFAEANFRRGAGQLISFEAGKGLSVFEAKILNTGKKDNYAQNPNAIGIRTVEAPAPVPVPATLPLLGTALAGAGFLMRRKARS